MRLLSPALLFASTSILAPLSLCAGPLLRGAGPDIPGAAPLHVPICEPQGGPFDLYVCARLLTNLRNLPYYQQRQSWSERAGGEGHLPAIFSLSDRTRQRQCFLTLDLYEPGVPLTAKEIFSLSEEQHELNNIYFECLKAKGQSGFNRIGFFGNIAAFLGPRVNRDNPFLDNFRSLSANNGTGIDKVPVVDLTDVVES